MTLVALVLSSLLAAVGAIGIVSPPRLLRIVRRLQTPAGLYLAAAIRLVLGVALFVAAPASRAPGPLRILGVVAVLAGVATPLFGLERFRGLLDWWSAQGAAFVRVWAAFACSFGLALVYALVP